jgi:glycosyltransferase involved in cell wall biosynthesis
MNAVADKRVLMLLENNAYPQDRRVLAEASALTDAGYRVTVIAPASRGQAWHEVIDGVAAYRYPAPPALGGLLGFTCEYGYSAVAILALSLIVVVTQGIDIVHANNPPDLLVFIGGFYKLFGVRFVFDHHDLAPEMYYAKFGGNSRRLIHRVLLWLERLSCRVADRVLETNESYRTIDMTRNRVPIERTVVVRNGPNLDVLRQVDPDPGIRCKGQTIIGYVGTMGVQDGVDYLLRALRHLSRDLRRTDFFCVLIGDGDAWPRLRALTSELGLDDHVRFTGTLSSAEFLPYLSAADICVEPAPSNAYNDRSTMIKIMEYMALAKPIVAFDLPEHRATAQAAATYVKPNDEMAFARALATLMDDADGRQRLGAMGRQRVESSLAWPYSVPHLLEAYRGLFPAHATATGVSRRRRV